MQAEVDELQSKGVVSILRSKSSDGSSFVSAVLVYQVALQNFSAPSWRGMYQRQAFHESTLSTEMVVLKFSVLCHPMTRSSFPRYACRGALLLL